MPVYVMLSKLTESGAETIKLHPERILEVDKEMEAFGIKVLHQFAVLGAYDFVNVIEAPDNMAVARASVELGSRGSIHVETLPAVPVEEFMDSIK
ncbi:MAG: GYD domain-containing protein [Coriobacteriia bacterium]|nr:GYD domain-containing protein [Coriobacteriia bacterium]